MPERADDVGNTETAVSGCEDFISALPDDVLMYLLSFLPSRNAVRTCVLARRWRTLWRSVPALRIKDDRQGYRDKEDPSESDDDTVHEPDYDGRFVDQLLRRRDPTPLNVCDIFSSYANFIMCHDSDEEAFRRIEPWIRYALSHEVQVLRVDADSLTANLALVSSHLKRVELRYVRFEGSLDFSSCPVLDVLEMSICSISGNILSGSLRHLDIEDGCFGCYVRSRISAPNLISLILDQDGGFPPLLDSMPSLVTASVAEPVEYEKNGEECFSVVLEGLSTATDLELITPYYQNSVFRMDLKWCPMFSKLKTLLLTDWCLADNFTGLVYFLRHSPILETLMLQLDIKKYEIYQVFRDERNKSREQGYNSREQGCNSRDQSVLSKHLKASISS
ncbi:hypothetical protein ACQ4PT_051485 [Festuca glaucescens]